MTIDEINDELDILKPVAAKISSNLKALRKEIHWFETQKQELLKEEIPRLKETGLSNTAIAKRLKTSPNTVWVTLNESLSDIQLERCLSDKGKIIALHRAGWTAKEIADDIDLRLDPKYIEEVLKKL